MTIRAVQRAIKVLFLVCEQDKPMGLSEISRRTEIDKATTLRLLATLRESGLVRQDEVSKRYTPGSNLVRLYSKLGSDIRLVVRPYIDRLVAMIDETVCLILPRGRERVCVDVREPERELRVVAPVGSTRAIFAGATGRIFLAYLPAGEARQLIHQADTRQTAGLRDFNRIAYLDGLPDIREQGFAFNISEVVQDTSALAAPIFDAGGKVIAALAIRAPASRMTEQYGRELAPTLIDATQQISAEIGYNIP
jgi:DNA-binding IclR family transcriptional regulator